MKDSIDKYLEAKDSGMNEEQAQLFARSWADAMQPHPEMVTKDYLDSKMTIIHIIGAAIFAICCVPVIQKLLGH